MLLLALRHRPLAAGAWFVILPGLLFGCLSVLSPLDLDRLGWSAVRIGALFLVSAGIEALLSPWVGRLSDRHGPMPLIRAALAGSALGALVLPWLGSAWVLAIVVTLASLAFGLFFVPGTAVLTVGAEEAGLDHALAHTLLNLAWAPGKVVGSAAGGTHADATSDAVPYLALTAACVVTLALVARGPREGAPATASSRG
jgi:predicted MFS family arabinose efflux permease